VEGGRKFFASLCSQNLLLPLLPLASDHFIFFTRKVYVAAVLPQFPAEEQLTMGIPSTVISGTIGYLVLCVVAIGLVFSSRATGILSKDNAETANVVVITASFCMWLFWLCAWMHQWHPLIAPIYEG
jgi:V-type H+-transporting ATPase subunit e